jgi:hypothetical protein
VCGALGGAGGKSLSEICHSGTELIFYFSFDTLTRNDITSVPTIFSAGPTDGNILTPEELMARIPGALFFSLLLASIALAQNPPAQRSTSKAPRLSMPMVAPVFLEDTEFTSTLTLVNDAIEDLSARVLVLDPHGVAAAQKELHLPGHTSLPIRIHDLLEESRSAVTTGSVIVIPQPGPGMPIGGQLSITSRAGSIPSYIEEEMLMPDEKTTPGMYRTSALAVKGSPIIALKSLAQTTQTVTLECFSEKTGPTKGTVQLPSGESILVAACDVSQTGRAAISEAMSDDPAVDRGAVGVAITTTAPSGDLIGYGFGVYRDDRGPYFTSLNLTDPAAMLSSSTIFTGIPAGPTDTLLRTSFHPELAISNFSVKPAHVSVTMATTTVGKTKADVMQTLVLAPRSSKTVKLPPHGDPGMANSLVVHSSLAPGEVVSQFVAWGDSLFRTVELQAKDNDSIQNGGGHPWTIEPGTDSTLLLFNHSTDGPKRFNVLVNSGKQLWQNHYMIAPMETKAISIRSIVEKQTPDEKGKKLDKETISGQVGWWTRLPKWGKGRLMVSSPHDGLARSYSCGNCAALCNFGAYLDPFTSAFIGVNSVGDLGNISVQQCLLTCTQQCGGTPQGPSSEATYTWTSLNTSIATVSGGLHSALASFKGMAAGSATGHFEATDYQCTAVGSAPVTVQACPTSVTLNSITPLSLQNSSTQSFPTWESGVGILTAMQVSPATRSDGSNWNGTVITENVVLDNINTCPSNIPVNNVSGGTFTVGGGQGTHYGVAAPATNDVYWDWHVRGSTTSWLNAPGVTQSSCTQAYSQSYFCDGTQIGSFYIVYSFSRSTINGTPVTLVSVTKQ